MIRRTNVASAAYADPARLGLEHEEDTIPVGSAHHPHERAAEDLAADALSVSDSYIRRLEGPGRRGEMDGLEVRASALREAGRSGRPLDDGVRARMETGFSADFSDVRVHDGPAAANLARDMNARAFTTGSDIYFARGEYAPGTAEGDHVLAHELAHTTQSGDDAVAHRFPAEVLSAPISWARHAGNVFRPGEGASGGVYIISSRDPNGAVKKVVVKPVFGKNALGRESPEQLAFGDKALATLFGMRAPKSRVVKRGPEFAELVSICKPHQPAKDPEDAYWKPMEDAEGFVVMAEVPSPKSIAALAKKAPTDQQASDDLLATVFDRTFLADLGRLCIADMLLGNDDRIVYGAMNLGNVMVSINNGKSTLHAIDTTAKLKVPTPSEVAQRGGGPGGFNEMKKYLDKGSGQTLDDFMEVLVNQVQRNTPEAGENAPPPVWQALQQRYEAGKQQYRNAFDFGWTDMLLTAMELAGPGGDRRVKESLEGKEQEDLSTGALRTHIAYMGGRAFGESHEEATGRAVAIALVDYAKNADRQRIEPPTDDAMAAKPLKVPNDKVLAAEYSRIPGLPTPIDLNRTVPSKGKFPLMAGDYEVLQGLPSRISLAHGQVDVSIGATKKRLGRETPRNRSVLGHTVVDAVAGSAGGNRLGDAMTYIVKVAGQMAQASSAKFNPNEAYTVAAFMDDLARSANRLEANVTAYKSQLAAGASALRKTKIPERGEYVEKLNQTARLLDITTKTLADAKVDGLPQFAKIIRRSNREHD